MAAIADTDHAPLVEDTHAGDAEALSSLYARYAGAVYRTALRLTGSSADAEDVLQDTFLALPESLDRYDGRGNLEGWVRRVATRTALLHLRRARRRREIPLDEQQPASRSRLEEDAINRTALEHATARLPERLRAVFVLYEVEGYAHAEIARLLAIRRGTSEVRLHRARGALRRLLGSES